MRMSRRFWNFIRPRVFLVCSSVALCGTVLAQSGGGYLITTVAGNGFLGSGGDGGIATAAQLNGPFGVAVDASGTCSSRIKATTGFGRCPPAGSSPPLLVAALAVMAV